MEVDQQLNLFEPVYLLRESALRKLRVFDLDGAQEDLTGIQIVEPNNRFATSSLIAAIEFRKRIYTALKGKDTLRAAMALQKIWADFKSEANLRFRVDSILTDSLHVGVRRELINMLESCDEEELAASYPALSLGRLKLESGDYQGAEEALRKMLALHPGDPRLLTTLANTCYHLGRFAHADEFYMRAFLEDTEEAFREGVENKVLTLTLESFLAEGMALCWFFTYAVMKGALKVSPSLRHLFRAEGALSSRADGETRSLPEKERVRLFYACALAAEEAEKQDWEQFIQLRHTMKELDPDFFSWYLDNIKS